MIPHAGAKIGFQPRIRKGAFFEAAWRYGCRSFSVYNRTYVSSTFSNPLDEYWQAVDRVALWPVMGERQVEISGPDASCFVQLLTPRDMSKCAVGQCKYILITAEDGGILSDPIALRLEEDRYWLSTSDSDLELWARGVAVNAGLDVRIRDAGVSVLQVPGPKSAQLLADLFGEALLGLKFYRMVSVPYHGTDLIISRTGWSGDFSFEIYLAEPALGDRLFDDLMAAGKVYGIAPGCVSHPRRIESGILSWGVDMTPAENPFEVGLDRLVDLDSTPDFIGKEALTRLKSEPLRRRLVGLEVSGDQLAPNEDIWPVTANGARVGKLTSLAHSPRLERNIGLAILDIDFTAPDTEVAVETWDGPRAAQVRQLPFVKKTQSMAASELQQKPQLGAAP